MEKGPFLGQITIPACHLDQIPFVRIDELYDSVQKCDGMAAALPDVVDRLETLQGLHQQGE